MVTLYASVCNTRMISKRLEMQRIFVQYVTAKEWVVSKRLTSLLQLSKNLLNQFLSLQPLTTQNLISVIPSRLQ